jgi:hypothetical protein
LFADAQLTDLNRVNLAACQKERIKSEESDRKNRGKKIIFHSKRCIGERECFGVLLSLQRCGQTGPPRSDLR